MTAVQIVALPITCAAAIVAVWGAVASWRAAREARARSREFPVAVGDGVITFPHRMSDAEVREFRARWHAAYGKPGGVEGRSEEEPGPG